jgi:hypothetical protein
MQRLDKTAARTYANPPTPNPSLPASRQNLSGTRGAASNQEGYDSRTLA